MTLAARYFVNGKWQMANGKWQMCVSAGIWQCADVSRQTSGIYESKEVLFKIRYASAAHRRFKWKGGYMEWKFDSKQPIYAQLVDQMTVRIVTGLYAPGSKLGSVRDLAEEAGVNPNTMQRALSAIEDSGLVHSQRTSGRFITEDMDLIQLARRKLAAEKIKMFAEQMKQLGFSKEEIVELLEGYSYE